MTGRIGPDVFGTTCWSWATAADFIELNDSCGGKPEELLHHSDQGSQYSSEHFQKLLTEQGITCSMSRAGEVWDNSAMESFFSTLKIERVHRKVYRTRAQARADVFDFIEAFYNIKRRHSTIGYISPVKFEEALFA